jgi:hypothetical protein
MRSINATPNPPPADIAKQQAWLSQLFASAATLPRSFIFNEKRITGIPTAWQPTTQQRHIDATLTETIFTGQEPATGLQRRDVRPLLFSMAIITLIPPFTRAHKRGLLGNLTARRRIRGCCKPPVCRPRPRKASPFSRTVSTPLPPIALKTAKQGKFGK